MAEVMSIDAQQRCTWNHFAADLAAAAIASVLVSPWVAAIDKIIYKRAHSGASFAKCARSLFSKVPSFNALFIPFLVYFGTYATANCFDTYYSNRTCEDPTGLSHTTSKFIATTAVATGLCIYKDGYFASLACKGRAPLMSYLFFAARDAVTVAASFNMPALIAPKLAETPFAQITPFQSIFSCDESRLKMAQFLVPASSQLVSTPMHLLGLDFTYRRAKLPIRERISAMRQHFNLATPLRVMRILPSFGMGGIVNAGCRTTFATQFSTQFSPQFM